jgi:hypothetical protein
MCKVSFEVQKLNNIEAIVVQEARDSGNTAISHSTNQILIHNRL